MLRSFMSRPLTARRVSALGFAALAAGHVHGQFQGIAGPVSIPHEGFGRFVAAVPDVDADGVLDVAVAAVNSSPIWGRDGIYVYSGRTGAFLRTMVTPGSSNPWALPPSFKVTGLTGLRDVDGDGHGDVAAAVEQNRNVLVSSGATGQQLHMVPQPPSQTPRRFGASVAALDDVDHDGRGDFVVGAPADPGLFNKGAVYIFSGASRFLLRTVEHGAIVGGVIPDPQFGSLVASTPDLNNDGHFEILVASGQGVSVVSSATGAILRVIFGPSDAGGFGQALASCPDADGDGTADIVISAPLTARAATAPLRGMVAECGRVYLYSGKTGALLRVLNGAVLAGGRFGASVAGVPDLTGDGRGDVIVGAPHNPESMRGSGFGPGTVQVFNGATGAPVTVLNSPNAEMGGAFGISVVGLPDTTGNGRGEVLVGAPYEDPGAANLLADKGRAYFRRF